MKPLFKKSIGKSNRFGHAFGWNNMNTGSTSGVTCELCGTSYSELNENDSSRTISSFLGLQVVEECCGHVFDILYQEIGEEFCIQFLEDFARDPTNPRFAILLMVLERILKGAKQTAQNVANTSAELEKTLGAIKLK